MTSASFIRLSALLFIFFTAEVHAAIPDYSDNLLEFSLNAGHRDTQFIFPTNSLNTSFDSLDINWYEAFTSYFDAGLEIGKFEMTQADNSLASARLTKGQYAGLLLRFTPLESHYLNLIVNINYRYNQSNGTNLDQSTEFTWHRGTVSAELQFPLSEALRLATAIETQRISGEQRDSGPISQITSFSEKNSPNYRLGLDIRSNRHHILRINWQTGATEGASINFVYKF